MNPGSQDEDNDDKDKDGGDDGGDGDHIFHILKSSLWFGRQTVDNLLSI